MTTQQPPNTFDAFPGGLSLPAGLCNFVASLLAGVPVEPPEAASAEWQDFLEDLQAYWIMPLLYWQIGKLPAAFHPPAEVMDKLRDTFLAGSGRSMQVAKQIKKIVDAFEAQGVDFLVLKGAAMAPWLYPHPATRTYSDIDLLARPSQTPQAREILKELGYRCICPKFSQSSLHCLYKHEEFVPGMDMPNCKQVELHWNFDLSSGLLNDAEVEAVFSRAVEVSASLSFRGSGATFKTLNPVDCLIANSIHMGIHSSDPVTFHRQSLFSSREPV